jgi:hypothetical protein
MLLRVQVGMMGVYDTWGQRHTCTILQVRPVSSTDLSMLDPQEVASGLAGHVSRLSALVSVWLCSWITAR